MDLHTNTNQENHIMQSKHPIMQRIKMQVTEQLARLLCLGGRGTHARLPASRARNFTPLHLKFVPPLSWKVGGWMGRTFGQDELWK